MSSMGSESDDSQYQTQPQRHRPLGFWSVVAIIFFGVAGGPFGIEDSVRYGGPRLALTSLFILPIIWSFPEALVTAELSTMFPEDSGFVAWVTAAFGPFWGIQEAFLSWISGVIDNSIYPLFLARYLKWFFPILEKTIPLKIFLTVSSMLLTYMNYRGLKVVGRASVFLTLFILCPFIVLGALGYHQVDPSNWLISKLDSSETDLYAFLNVMFWNLNYWDSVSTLSGEIGQATNVLPRALSAAVFLVFAGYFFPVLLGIGIVGSEDWPEGFFSYLAKRVSGVWLEGWIILSACASQIGLFTAELSSDAYLLLGLAEKGMLPKIFAHKSKYNTPTLALLLSCSGVVIMIATFDFISIIEMLNNAYCFAQLLEFAALVHLRFAAPTFPRPFKIPLSPKGLMVMLVPAVFLALIVLLAPFYYGEWDIVIFTGVVLISGFLLYHVLEYLKKYNILKFDKMTMTVLSSSLDSEEQRIIPEVEVYPQS